MTHPAGITRDAALPMNAAHVLDEVAYVFDGTLEGLLCAIFASYANRQDPSEVCPASTHQPRLLQEVVEVATDIDIALRVKKGLSDKAGHSAFRAVAKASLSSEYGAATAAYRFVRYAMDVHKGRLRPLSNISHPSVAPLVKVCRSVDNECEHMRQFVRFEHLRDESADVWFARCNPRDAVVPLVMDYFVERFNVQPFMVFDEVHHMCGVFDGASWRIVKTTPEEEGSFGMHPASPEEPIMQDAWRRFYRALSIDARYNPELRRQLMPKRLWRNLTEMQDDRPGLSLI